MNSLRRARMFDSSLHLKKDVGYHIILYGGNSNGTYTNIGVNTGGATSNFRAWTRSGGGSWTSTNNIFGCKIVFDDSTVYEQYTQNDTTSHHLGNMSSTIYDQALYFKPPCGGRVNKIEFGFQDPGSADYPSYYWELYEGDTIGSGTLLAHGPCAFDGSTWASAWGDKRLTIKDNSLTTGMLSNGGLTDWNATNLLDGDSGTDGFTVDDGDSGDYFKIDFGEPVYLYQATMNYGTASMWNLVHLYDLKYSSDDSSYTSAVQGSFDSLYSSEVINWDYVGAYRYWRLYIDGGGLYFGDIMVYNMFSVKIGKIKAY